MQGKYLEKIVVNVGIGKLATGTPVGFKDKVLPQLMSDIAAITGQKPAMRPAKKSIAGFKVREGSVVGLKVTLRGKRMEYFLDKLNKVIFPRLRDFKGLDLKFVDQNGNLSIGLKDQIVFPEINPETTKVSTGMQITVVPKIRDKEEAIDFYRKIGVPLRKPEIRNQKSETNSK